MTSPTSTSHPWCSRWTPGSRSSAAWTGTDRHAWEFSWDERGLRLMHDDHTFVLGIPSVFRDFLADRPKA